MRAKKDRLTKNMCVAFDVVDPTNWEEECGSEMRRCAICEKLIYPGDSICETEDGRVRMHESCAVYRRVDMTVSEVLERVGVELYAGFAR